MTIDKAYRTLATAYNKNQQGNLTPAQANLAFDIYQTSILNDLLGNEQQYQPGMPIPKTGFSINQKNREELRPITKAFQTLAVTAGLVTYPTDYVYYDTMTTVAGLLITEATPDEIAILNQSQIKPPSATYPRFTLFEDGIRIYPSSLTSIKLSYVRKPVTPVWNYTIVNNEPVYAATGGVIGDGVSHNWELSELVHLRILFRCAQLFGLNLSMPELTQYALAAEAQGQ